jgi:hypothetical protein
MFYETPLCYPQITQIHADFWDFFKDCFLAFGFAPIEMKHGFINPKTISLICVNLRNLRITKRCRFSRIRAIVSRGNTKTFTL